jgi:hypothetical protein
MAQTSVGGKVGLNYTIISTSYDPEPDPKPDNASGIGFHLGAYAEIGLSDMIAIRPELLFSTHGVQQNQTTTSSFTFGGTTTTTETKSDDKQTLSYLEIPLLLAIKANDHIGLHIGPGFGLLMGGKVNSSGSSTSTTTDGGSSSTTTSDFDVSISGSDVTDGLNKLEIALVVGAAYETDGGLNFGLRFWRGLNTLNKETDFGGSTVKSYTNMLQFSVGYTFMKD